MGRKKTLSIDFDGVLHSYNSGWKGANIIPDPPVESAIDWLTALDADGRFSLCIFSSRNDQEGGVPAMKRWLLENGLSEDTLDRISFPQSKPPAHMSIDDRGYQFKGVFPNIEDIHDFVPWNKVAKK